MTVKRSIFAEKVANKIARLGLTAPAILLLEAHKPLSFISSQLLLVAQPTLDLFLTKPSIRDLADLLADSAQVEQLIVNLESKMAQETASREIG